MLAPITIRRGRFAPQQRFWRRLPLVVLLLAGMLMAMIHCADDGLAGTSIDQTIELAQHDPAAPGVDHQGLAHSGHCLSHVNAEQAMQLRTPELITVAMVIGRERLMPHHAVPPLLKPPRA